MKYNEIIKMHGKPFYRFKPHGIFTEKQIGNDDIPDECMIFKTKHSSEYLVYSRSGERWIPNHGERWVIRELFNQIIELTRKIKK